MYASGAHIPWEWKHIKKRKMQIQILKHILCAAIPFHIYTRSLVCMSIKGKEQYGCAALASMLWIENRQTIYTLGI